MLLAIDTATRLLSIALYDGRQVLAEMTWHAGTTHSVQLAPSIQELLTRAQTPINDITALGVAIGPGSYTGVRIGVSMAKGLAAAHRLPLVDVTTLDALAAAQPSLQSRYGLITTVLAGRGRVIAAAYRWSKREWVKRAEPRIMEWEALFDSIDAPAYLSGEINDEGYRQFEAAQAREVPVELLPAAFRLRRAGFLAQVAWERLQNAAPEQFKADAVMPIYLKSGEAPASNNEGASDSPAEASSD